MCREFWLAFWQGFTDTINFVGPTSNYNKNDIDDYWLQITEDVIATHCKTVKKYERS